MAEKPFRRILPPPLNAGDTIGIAAPASSFDHALFNKGIETLRSMGFNPAIPDEIFDKSNYLAGSDQQRAEIVNRLFNDADIKAVICARGGFGTMRILPYLDYPLIREHPKWLVGFSDISALLWALYSGSGLLSLHGPTVTTLAKADKHTVQSLDAALKLNLPLKITNPAGRTIRSGSTFGPIIGGNLTTLCHLMGTRFSLDCSGAILLIEDRNEALYRVDRMLSQIRLSPWFQKIAGVAVGTFEDCGHQDDIDRMVAETFDELHIPVLAGIDIGHGKTNLTVPFGMEAVLDADEQFIEIGKKH